MITKEEVEKEQVKQRTNAIHEVFDGLIEWWFIKKDCQEFKYKFEQVDFTSYGVTLDSVKEELDKYVSLGGYSGYSIDEDNIITFRR